MRLEYLIALGRDPNGLLESFDAGFPGFRKSRRRKFARQRPRVSQTFLSTSSYRLIKPKLHAIGKVSLDAIVGLAHEFSASLAATGIRTMRMTREPLILVAQDWAGTNVNGRVSRSEA